MSVWDSYPETYRQNEVRQILRAVRGGECVSVVGLSGAGKSNLMYFLANRAAWDGKFILVDGNRMVRPSVEELFEVLCRSAEVEPGSDPWGALEKSIESAETPVCFLLDRFDALPAADLPDAARLLRALRDPFKYKLTYVIATRRPLDAQTELAELFFGNTLFLGPLEAPDVHWNIQRFAARMDMDWDDQEELAMRNLSGGYPALLKAVCEARADGCRLTLRALRKHPAVRRRLAEFWQDDPPQALLQQSQLENIPLLSRGATSAAQSKFSPKETRLLEALQARPGQTCRKDDLIRAVWPEDAIYEEGVRDASLAQLVTRLRKKLADDSSLGYQIHNVQGRGYSLKNRGG